MNIRRFLPQFSLYRLFILVALIAVAATWYAQRLNWEIQRTEQLQRLESEYSLVRDRLNCKIIPLAESRTFARALFGKKATPAIQKIEISLFDIVHQSDLPHATFEAKPQSDWFDYSNVPELETLWVSDYGHAASISSAKHLTELREFGCVSYVDSFSGRREHNQLVSNYIAAFPNLPKLKYFHYETYNFNPVELLRGNAKFLTGKDMQSLVKKAPALQELYVHINNLDEQMLTVFEPLNELRIVSIHLREQDAEKYLTFVQNLLRLPRLEELYVANVCSDLFEPCHDPDYQLDSKSFRQGMVISPRWLEIHHPTLKKIQVFEAKRIHAWDCPELVMGCFASGQQKPLETKYSNCPKLEIFPDAILSHEEK